MFSCGNLTAPKVYYIGADKDSLDAGTPKAFCSELPTNLQPGDSVYFMAGTPLKGSFNAKGIYGTAEKPIVITSYGQTPATIDSGNEYGLTVSNSSHVTVENINFSGSGRKNGNSANGVLIDCCRDVRTIGLDIQGYRKAGLEIRRSKRVVVERIHAHDNGFAGIYVLGEWERHEAASDIVIRDCIAENNPGDPTILDNHSGSGIIVAGCKRVTVEYCVATNNGWDMPRTGNGPVGIWAFEADNVLFQYCISHHNKTSKGGKDGGGFDFDGGVSDSMMQYCLSYENEGPGYCLFQFKGASMWHNNVVRFCISENDGNVSNGMGGVFIWNGSGDPDQLKNCHVYNNTVYNERGGAISHLKDESLNTNFFLYNNIFIGKNELNKGDKVSSVFLGNVWYSLDTGGFNMDGVDDFRLWAETTGNEFRNGRIVGYNLLPDFNNKIGKTGLTDPHGLINYNVYKLRDGSPLADGGIDLKKEGIEHGGKDFNQNEVTTNLIGACQ